MKKIWMVCFVVLFVAAFACPGFAEDKTYRIEILQVTSNDPFDYCLNGFLNELEKGGIVQGKNLVINRRVIDFDVEKGGLWKKIGVLFEIKSQASEIVKARPDLVLTIGTPATRYAKDKIIGAGIPLVFSSVAIPEAAGCKSLTEAGPGFTGATIYMDIDNFLKIARLAFPQVNTYGIIHSDDDNALAQVELLQKASKSAGMTFITKEVGKSDSLTPAAEELIEKGAKAFLLPMDTYYGMRDNEPCRELAEITRGPKIPAISMMYVKIPVALLYIGTDFDYVGSLSAKSALKILKEGARPGDLSIQKQDDLSIMVDVERMKELQIDLPMGILQLAKAL